MQSQRPDDRIARAHFALYSRMLRRIHATTTTKTRRHVETASFILLLHAVALFALLHVSFISSGASDSCFAPFVSTHLSLRTPSEAPLVRIQVIPSITCPVQQPSCAASKSLAPPLASFVFASQRGLLSLLDEPGLMRQLAKHQRHELALVAVPRSSSCFNLRWIGQSSPLWDALLDHALGYDTIVLNHVLGWRGGHGVMLNEATGRVHDVGFGAFTSQSSSMTWLKRLLVKIHTFYLCLSLFFVCVALIAFMVHQSHVRLLTFSDLVQHRVTLEDQVDYARALGAHCAQSLMLIPVVLGMVFFLLELYRDYVLAFGMLVVVGFGEGFSIICARAKLSQLFYPPLFFCWFALFHIYLVAFPLGFSHFALFLLALTLLHTTIFFTNCFELPAFLTRPDMSINHTRREPLS